MKFRRALRTFALLSLMVIPFIVSGCGLFSKSVTEAIDPPQTEVLEEEFEPTNSWMQSVDGANQFIVYLQDRNSYLAPISLPVGVVEEEEAAVKLLEIMVDQGIYSTSLPADFRAMIPQGTEVLDYELDEETSIAHINFSDPFNNYNAADERAIVESIIWTLTSLDNIKGVEISVEDEALTEMPIAGYPIDGALTREMGINIELAEGVNYTHAAPVTLYFSATTLNQEQYYVPVTRMIERPDSQALAAIEQLIYGPLNEKSLTKVIMPDVAVTALEEYDGVVYIDLHDEAYEPGSFVPSEMLQAVVLSLAENTGINEVQIRMNGDINIFDEHNNSYSAPVSKPIHVNALKM